MKGRLKYTEEYIISLRFGKLKAIKECNSKYIGVSKRKTRYFICKCDCGKLKEISLSHLLSDKIKSCGCSKINEHFKTHGLSNHSLHIVWMSMKQRCYNKNHKRYKDWGGRGISIDDNWINDFINFFNWSIKSGYKKGLQIDRINNDGNYTPDNCRYVTAKVNSNNKRKRIDSK